MTGLTQRQAEVLAWIRQYLATTGGSPTIREICVGIGLTSTNGATEHVVALQRKGYLVRRAGTARGIRLTGKGMGGQCPVCGALVSDDQEREAVLQ